MNTKNFNIILGAAMLAVIFAVSGCGANSNDTSIHNDEPAKDSSEKIKVVASLFPQYDFAKNVGGDFADVTLLLPPGGESHTYEPTPADIEKIHNADIFLYTGEEMEPWAEKIINSVDSDVMAVDLSSGIIIRGFFDAGHDAGQHSSSESQYDDNLTINDIEIYLADGLHTTDEIDPHIWLDLTNSQKMVETICSSFSEKDEKNADYFRENADAYINELTLLDDKIMSLVSEKGKKPIVFGSHFAYYHFVERYNIPYVSLYDSCGSESEPSVQRVIEITDFVNNNNISYIYHEELANPKIARSICEETGAELLELSTLHNVTKEQFNDGISFIDIMNSNIANLEAGFR